MEDFNLITDTALLTLLGKRITTTRIERNLTQSNLAKQAGISKRTLERMENGESVQLTTFIRILRVLELLHGINILLPPQSVQPLEMIKREGKKRLRVVHPRKEKDLTAKTWKWGDEE
ncbi:MAG: XRE family transcriptional regulator [Spirochaetia bacterium]|nr:XRE family transcriptional regulator [Spirochaetia bacterium]